MKIAIVGSRNYPRLDWVEKYVLSLPKDTVIVSGGAMGVDRTAELAACKAGLKTRIFLADWITYGRAAGFRRNAEIVAYADKVVAFWDGESRGTLDTMHKAQKAGKPCTYVLPNGSMAGDDLKATYKVLSLICTP